MEPLSEDPLNEGDDQEVSVGTDVEPVEEADLEDAPDHPDIDGEDDEPEGQGGDEV